MDYDGVVNSKAGSDYWAFTPVWTVADWRHPLAGHREFRLTDNQNGTFTFYTRGRSSAMDASGCDIQSPSRESN